MLSKLLRTSLAAKSQTSLVANNSAAFSSVEGEPKFLEMVHQYFDAASSYTKISPDKLNYYKKVTILEQIIGEKNISLGV